MIKSIKEPVLTLTIHLTSPMIRMEAEPEGAGATTPLEGPPGGMTPPPRDQPQTRPGGWDYPTLPQLCSGHSVVGRFRQKYDV